MTERVRSIEPSEELALKAAVRRAAKLGGGAASVQHMVGADESLLSKYGSPSEPARHCPLPLAVELDRQAGAPVIVSALAALLGYRLVKDDGDEAAGILGLADMAAVQMEAAEFLKAAADAGADGHYDAADREKLNKECEELVAAARRAQAKIGGGR